MRRSRFTEEKTTDLCRKYGISDATFYNWKAKFGGMTVTVRKRGGRKRALGTRAP